jgi:hypothetical protein
VLFWKTVVREAKQLPEIGERCRLFFHLYAFLTQYAPSSVESGVGRAGGRGAEEVRRGSWSQRQKGGLRMMSSLGVEVEALEKEGKGEGGEEGGEEEGWESCFEGNNSVVISLKKLYGFRA